jgi:hypothetical protein
MEERWNRFSQTFEGEIRSHETGTVFATNVLSFEEIDLDLYYLRVGKQGYKKLEEGVYVVINKTPEELKDNQDLLITVSSIATEQFLGPKLSLNGTIDYDQVIIPVFVGQATHVDKNWSILRLQPPKPEMLNEALLESRKNENGEYYLTEEDLN